MPKRKKKEDLEQKVEELNSARLRMSRLFRKMGLDPDEATQLSLYIEDMASINTTARLESKIDAQNSKYNILVIMFGAMMTAFLAIAGWLIATGGGGAG